MDDRSRLCLEIPRSRDPAPVATPLRPEAVLAVENTRRGRRLAAATASLLEVARDEAPWRNDSGATRAWSVGHAERSAHSQRQVRCFRRGGGGDTTGFDAMWVNGCVQPAVVQAAVGFGACVGAAGRSW